jgi:hypothetical protein
MSAENTEEDYAFPIETGPCNNHQKGMTLRDYFAGQALAGILATDVMSEARDAGEIEKFDKYIAVVSYKVADAMLAARNQPSEGYTAADAESDGIPTEGERWPKVDDTVEHVVTKARGVVLEQDCNSYKVRFETGLPKWVLVDSIEVIGGE